MEKWFRFFFFRFFHSLTFYGNPFVREIKRNKKKDKVEKWEPSLPHNSLSLATLSTRKKLEKWRKEDKKEVE